MAPLLNDAVDHAVRDRWDSSSEFPGAAPFCEAIDRELPFVVVEMPEIPLRLTVTTIGLTAAV